MVPIIAALVAVIASSVGVIVAVDQLTLRSRLRRTAEATEELAKHEDNANRLAALRSIHDVAIARLVAGWAVPWWRFAEFAVWFVLGPVTLALTAARQGWTGTVQTILVTNIVIVSLVARRGIRIYLERQRIAREYLTGADVAPPRLGMLQQMEGGTLSEFVMGAVISAGASLAALGVGLLVHDINTPWGFLCLLPGIVLAWSPTETLRARAVRPLELKPAPPKVA